MAVLKRDHQKELQKTKAATGMQLHMIKWHSSKSAKITRWSWSLAAGITCRHATECRVQAWVTAAIAQWGQTATPPSCGTSSWVLCQQTSSYCLHMLTRNTHFFLQVALLQLLHRKSTYEKKLSEPQGNLKFKGESLFSTGLFCCVWGRMCWEISTLWLHPLQKRG